MKRLVIAGAIALASCAPNGGVNSAGSVAVTIGKATASADAVYVAAYNAGVAAVKSGKLSREAFLSAEQDAYTAILLIRAAQTIADLTAAQAQLSSAAAKLNAN